jgi:hypothetical protein
MIQTMNTNRSSVEVREPYQLQFPDARFYRYPHIRKDFVLGG